MDANPHGWLRYGKGSTIKRAASDLELHGAAGAGVGEFVEACGDKEEGDEDDDNDDEIEDLQNQIRKHTKDFTFLPSSTFVC